MSKIDLLLHPIRIRIVMALMGRSLTPAQIAETVDDVPLTSLYRHLNALAEGGIVEVVKEHPIRGTVERVYALVEGATRVKPEEMPTLSVDDHLQHFMVFLTSLLHDFSHYLESWDGADTPPESTYSKIALSLSDDEYHAMTEQMRQIAMQYVGREDGVLRKRYSFGFISIPES